MKKFVLFALAFLLVAALSSCLDRGDFAPATEPSNTVTTTSATTSAHDEPTPPVTTTAQPSFDYTTLECTPISAWKEVGLTWKDSQLVLLTSIPSDWELDKTDESTYTIFCNNAEIGTISTEISGGDYEFLESYTAKNGDIELDYDVRRVKTEYGDEYKRVFGFWIVGEEMRSVYMEVEYTALDDAASEYISQRLEYGNRDGGEMRIREGRYNSSNKILVQGNSFVGTSSVATILSRFIADAGKPYIVEANYIGGGSFKGYKDSPRFHELEEGRYKVVFMCGIYNRNDVNGIQAVIDACEKSNTVLVFFPAHNEFANWIETAKKEHPGQTYLDWKGELDALVASGVDHWDLCVDDAHGHTEELGGYVGACMIYKMLFGEAPPDFTGSINGLTMDTVHEKLGDYAHKTSEFTPRLYNVYEMK